MKTAAGLAFLITLALTPLVIRALRHYRVLDVPGERSSHATVIPRGGGIAVAVGAVAGIVLSTLAGSTDAASLRTLLVTVSLLAVVGLVDDMRTLDVFPRLGAQLLAALVCVNWALRNIDLPWGLRVLAAVAAVVWVMGFVNAFNFMDGINGISACTTIVAGGAFVIVGAITEMRLVSVCGAVIAAAALGFLPYNFPKARVFLGDIGSYFIGGWLAFTVLVGSISDIPPEALLAPLVLYLTDTSFTLASRIIRRQPWHESHRQHVYQRLVDLGWSHGRTTFYVAFMTAACSALGMVSLGESVPARIVADATIGALMVGYLATPYMLSTYRHRARPEPVMPTDPLATSS